jgi:hypothetical protein
MLSYRDQRDPEVASHLDENSSKVGYEDLNGSKERGSEVGAFLKVVGTTHSGAIKYQIGAENTGRLTIAREPVVLSDPSKAEELSSELRKYWSVLQKEPSRENYLKAATLGDACLILAGSWVRLVIAMRFLWETANGTHFEGLFDSAMDEITPHGKMLELVRRVAQAGVDARAAFERYGYESEDHYKSALEHLDQILAGTWKDARKGRMLYLTSKSEPLLNGVVSVPLGFVPKSFPDRTVSTTEGREVVHPKKSNADVLKEHFFPALMPRHKEPARLILWWIQRFPGIPLLIAKKDIADAFKWLWVLAESAGLFSTNFPDSKTGIGANLILMWLVLNFGWRGGPGCFVQFGTLLKLMHANFKPDRPSWHDVVPFKSMIWMDDLVVLEPDIGHRGIMSLGVAEALIQKLFGKDGLNQPKDLVEGLLEILKLTWGLIYDTKG